MSVRKKGPSKRIRKTDSTAVGRAIVAQAAEAARTGAILRSGLTAQEEASADASLKAWKDYIDDDAYALDEEAITLAAEAHARAYPPSVELTDDDEPWLDDVAFLHTTSSDDLDDDVPFNPTADPAAYKVTLVEDHHLVFPLLGFDVFVAGPPWEEAAFAGLFSRAGCRKAKSLEEADLCVFVGGADVNPALYGEIPHKETSWDDSLDKQDIITYNYCLERGIQMVGVCRGAQFLHVMNGGKLFQDVDNHYGDHSMLDVMTKDIIHKVSSVHHQMVIPNPKGKMQIVATANKSRKRYRNPDDSSVGTNADVEAFFYRDTCCFGVQGHPEYNNYNHFAVWTMKKLEDFIVLNLDVDWLEVEGKEARRRLRPDLLEQRKNAAFNPIIIPANQN